MCDLQAFRVSVRDLVQTLQALPRLLQVQILVRKVRNKAAGTIGEAAMLTAGLC